MLVFFENIEMVRVWIWSISIHNKVKKLTKQDKQNLGKCDYEKLTILKYTNALSYIKS